MAQEFAEVLQEDGIRYRIHDLTRDDMSKVLSDAFRYDKLVLAAASYDGGVFPAMEDFLHHLKSKAFQNRKVAIIENGSRQPTAAKSMREILGTMKNLEIIEPVLTIYSTMKSGDVRVLKRLAEQLK